MGSRKAWSPFNPINKSILFGGLIFMGIQAPLVAQEAQFTKPSWWFGAAAGANINFSHGTTQQLNSNLTIPAAFNKGNGVGLYIAPLLEYYRPESRWGMMLQTGYDSRRSTFEQILTPCNCPADLSTNLSYLTVEPSLRFAPFRSNFYLYAGPRIALNLSNEFTYQLGINPEFPDQALSPEVNGEFSNTNKNLISMQVGAGHDIPLSSQSRKLQAVLSPFVSFQPYFGQNPRSSESWTLTTIRIGAALKFGKGRAIPPVTPQPAAYVEPTVGFTVNSPENLPLEKRITETFPLRNHVYFNHGSTEIPNRYARLDKGQVLDFNQLEVFAPKDLSGRSDRQMTVYYNVLNIVGYRLVKNPSASINLIGSSETGALEGAKMAESVKQYLVGTWGIAASRIATEGVTAPRKSANTLANSSERELLIDGDRRVSIESSSPGLLKEFKGGLDKPLTMDAPEESYVTFEVEGAVDAFRSWSLEFKDDQGNVQTFGPYTEEKVRIPGKLILGDKPEGNYLITMEGLTESGHIVRKEATTNIVQWTPPSSEEAMRFSVIYEFNDAKAISSYEKYLTETVSPKISHGASVIICGHTDLIGEEAYNRGLSLARANDVKSILEKSLLNSGTNNVKFDIQGMGEDEKISPFKNHYPEERAYNRTVIIDVMPGK